MPYHEPQVRYALDPVIELAEATLNTRIEHSDVPLVMAGYVERLDSVPVGRSSPVPCGGESA